MMGGIGSGRRAGVGRDTVEDYRAIDVNRLHREGCLTPGWSGLWTWRRGEEQVASIGLRAERDVLRLTYRVRVPGGEWRDVDQAVRLERTPCRFGGSRPWFVCPGVMNGTPCRRRVAKLFGGFRWFLCRHCLDLTYASRRESRLDRRLRQAMKLRLRLGGPLGLDDPLPRRPRGMHRRTYARRAALIDELEANALRAVAEREARLLAILDAPRRERILWR